MINFSDNNRADDLEEAINLPKDLLEQVDEVLGNEVPVTKTRQDFVSLAIRNYLALYRNDAPVRSRTSGLK